MELDPNTTYLCNSDGTFTPVASNVIWCPAGEPSNRINATLARRIAASMATGRAAWEAGELSKMIQADRRTRRLRRALLARLPQECNPYLKGRAA
jgi:hypothetical protein